MSRQSQALSLSFVLIASVVFLDHVFRMDAPFITILFAASACALVIVLVARPDAVRKVALVCASAFLSLAMVETFMYYSTRTEVIITKTTPATWRRQVADIGSLPVPNTTTRFREFLDGRMIADVTYRIDANGLREIPAAVQGGPHKVAFFGCSFMFGHGVENDQTLPYYFVRASGGTFEGFNFAGEGWGPHQMLREIETGFVRRVAGVPELAIYEVIPDHLRRVSGRAPWEDGPKYVVCRGDEVCYSGPFHNGVYQIYRQWASQCWTIKFIEEHFARLSRPSDVPLFLAVLKRTRTLLEQRGTRFVIVLWDQNELGNSMVRTLRANHFDVIAVSSIVNEGDQKNHPLTQLDRHPSAAANRAIATYLWHHVADRSKAK
ncbi:MAG: hypothetical protein ACREQT_04500 [Candidatus Binataceae bacterium]